MGIYKETKNYKLINDSMLEMGKYIAPGSIDSIVCDPPYEINFLNSTWDNSGVAFNKETWSKCFDALKEGGYLLAFGGTRTYHRIACAIEDAGFEIRDCIMYLYGSGFPKSMNIGLALDKKLGVKSEVVGKLEKPAKSIYSQGENEMSQDVDRKEPASELGKTWKGWGTALKPAYEPVIVARKPFKGSLVDNIIKNGVGGINIVGCHVEPVDSAGGTIEEDNGRFPSNVIHDGSEDAIAGFPETTTSGGGEPAEKKKGVITPFCSGHSPFRQDSGSASRYFYSAKASKKDREQGMAGFDEMQVNDGREFLTDNAFQRGVSQRKNIHPTVKPCELMQYLVRMVTPKGGTIMDCFMGSGSTGKATMFENRERESGYYFIGIELTDIYLPICAARIDYALNQYEYEEKLNRARSGQLNLFDFQDPEKEIK